MKKFKVGKQDFPEFAGDVEVEVDETQFDVVPERFPPGLTERLYKGRRVRWVANFVLKKKPGAARRGVKVKYAIELDKSTGELVYFDGREIFPLPFRDLGNGKVRAELEADDPATGWTP
ncbi:MAG: hypothetical protein N2117_02720 [Anaerolineales bacterium]|nr:hypothetical protein [Anaerolineales bacterium]MCX7754146.1 hypothetical protein [Anaerolineales bacterium]MDW8278060.1 hypothetical protein [Anaerolineales bacterium]